MLKIHIYLCVALMSAGIASAGRAQTEAGAPCDTLALNKSIEETAQALRKLNRDSERRFQQRLQAIARERKWSEATRTAKANEAVDDRKLADYNAQIEELVSKLDSLSATPADGQVRCENLTQLKAVREQLLAVMTRKSQFILAQLEALGTGAVASAGGGTAPKAPEQPAQSSAVATVPPSAPKDAGTSGSAEAPTSGKTNQAQAAQGDQWAANIARTLSQSNQAATAGKKPVVSQPKAKEPARSEPATGQREVKEALATPPSDPLAGDSMPPLVARGEGYTAQEIREAGKGVFGRITSEFAIVVNHAFKKFGRPNGYIIGNEGGGAFLAGLRYGEGQLYARVNGAEAGPTPIYWQGPSLGVDVGAAGSRALFLVYNLDQVDTLFNRFTGVDGTAYVAGGFGLTVLGNGQVIIVPIRTGLGLRLGASLGYLKFTQRRSYNPF